MLLQFTIENFLSFRDEVTFSMVAVDSDEKHKSHLINGTVKKKHSILPLSAIYGANAAGKSNLIEAIGFAKSLIIEGTRANRNIPVATFKLGNYDRKPSKFEFIFVYEGSQYSYGFRLNREQIFEEWLYGIPSGKKREGKYFERITSEDKKTTVEYGPRLKGRSKKREQFLEFVAEGTRPNQLFLTEAIDRNVQSLNGVLNWFREVLVIIPAEAEFQGLEMGIMNNEAFTEFLNQFLESSVEGIASISTEEIELDFDSHFPNMPEPVKDDILQDLSSANKGSLAIIENVLGQKSLLLKKKEDEITLIRLQTLHRHEDGKLIKFSLNEESEGTQRLINLIPALFLLKEESEKVIFLDELDRRLHPLLSRRFVEMALHCRNKANQLIFTTHDTNLLDLSLLRRDEIWFVEKNQQGVSDIYSLAEFTLQSDLKIEKGYLNGRFGGIPFFGNLQGLGWLDGREEAE